MTIPQDVNDHITKSQKPVCDGCVATAVGIRNGQARNITLALATTRDFESRTDVCGVCGQTKKVTYANRT